MNDIGHAVEETWEVRERSLQQSTLSVSEVNAMIADGKTFGSAFGYVEQTTSYKYAGASITEGTVEYKNGGLGKYRENAISSREIYNKCASFLAEAFGEKSSELTLSDKAFDALFGKLGGDEKTFTEKAAQRRENLDKQLERLRRFMDGKLTAIRENDPDNSSLNVFADTCLKLGAYKYSDISALVKKMFADEAELR